MDNPVFAFRHGSHLYCLCRILPTNLFNEVVSQAAHNCLTGVIISAEMSQLPDWGVPAADGARLCTLSAGSSKAALTRI